MAVEYWWPAYLQGKREADFETDWERWKLDDPLPREAIRAVWDEIEERLNAYLANLTGDELARTFVYEERGESYTHTPAEILTQVAAHGLDHRAQIMAMIHQMGGPTFSQDYIIYVREQQKG